jgi:amidase
MDEILAAGSIAAIGAALRRRMFSVQELVAWYLARIAAFNKAGPSLNAVRSTNPNAAEIARTADAELADGRDRGPLHGIPVLLKDNILASGGMTASAGAAALADYAPAIDATLVQRLRRAGAIVIGKTNMTEFADYVSDVMPSEFSGAGGVVRNPHGLAYGRGQGSSVGSAASVAASFAPFAIGSETQNSIQAPASHTSVFGFKPSVGVVSRAGIFPLVPSQDSPGPITRSAADAALVMDALAGPDVRDTATLETALRFQPSMHLADLAGVRIGVLRRAQADRPEFQAVMAEFENALSRLSRHGAAIVDPCDLPAAEQIQEVRSSVFRVEFKAALNAFLADHGRPCGIESLAAVITWNEAHPDSIPYGQSLLLAAENTEMDERYLADRARDIALSRPAGIHAAIASANVDVLIAPMAAAAKCSGKAGTPVAAIPVGTDSTGAPFGITLLAPLGHDRRLLEIAAFVERAIGSRQVPRLVPKLPDSAQA